MKISFSGYVWPEISDTELIIKQLKLDEISLLSHFHVQMKSYLRNVVKNEKICHFYSKDTFVWGVLHHSIIALWVFVQERMVASGALFFNDQDPKISDVLASYARLSETSRVVGIPFVSPPFSSMDMQKVTHLENGCVSPEYQGFGLQRFLIQKRLQFAAQYGYEHIFATVDPENLASLKNLLRVGFKSVAYNENHYDGKHRFIMYRPVADGPEKMLNCLKESVWQQYMDFAYRVSIKIDEKIR